MKQCEGQVVGIIGHKMEGDEWLASGREADGEMVVKGRLIQLMGSSRGDDHGRHAFSYEESR